MNLSLWNILIPAIAGFLGIVFGSFKPIIDWHIEKRKLQREERKQLLLQIRKKIIAEDFSMSDFVKSTEYSQLRPYFRKQFIHSIEIVYKNKKQIVDPNAEYYSRRTGRQNEILDELSHLERKWALL